ncbi:alpha/beta fold hydrolase [Nocardioides limicola]|uniref:alpha/beta fold hydrolase n=1 Tax=Nocardioides limicola TaxID=2803368 RepID=UPI00193B37C3|nr:alpha/beta hydrolase [Nocardioides sp. DJM-14]
MTDVSVRAVLVPGAWMGNWIWEPTVRHLAERGIDAEAITLRGLEGTEPEATVAAVHLEDHIQQLVQHVERMGPSPVVLISHSYSAMVTACAADRVGDQVRGLIHLGGFLPVDGRALLDDWSDSDAGREQERADIEAAGHLWAPPPRGLLDHESDLTPADRDYLAARLTPHPGHTVTEPARLSSPVGAQPSTYVALSPYDDIDRAWRDAPTVATLASRWRRRHLVSGHWPMLSTPEATADLLAAEIHHYDSQRS